MDGTSVLILIGFGFLIFLAIKNSIRNSAERDGRAGKYEPSKLKADAKVNDVKVYTVGSKTNKSFRIVVYFDDSFNYAKVVKPTMRDDHFMSTTYTLSVEDKTNVIKEAIEQHALAINNNQKNKNISSGNALLDFNNAIFPNGDSSRNYQKNQLRVLMGDIDDENNYLKTFIYCLTHYLVNNENYQYVIKMLPIAHPEIKEEKAIKRIAAYTFIFAGTKKENLDLSKIEDMKFVDETVEKLDQQIKDVEKNSKMNEQPFDIERGTVREKPMFFKGVKATESYLNSLTDENGNKLHFGDRYCYSVDGINGMLDCYTMLDSNNDVYGQLYVSIYGADNYKYVPKGYLHPSLKNPDVEKTKEEQEDKSEQQNNNDVSFKQFTSSLAIEELKNAFDMEVEIRIQDDEHSRTKSDKTKKEFVEKEQAENENLVDVKVEETKTQNIQNDKPLFCRKCGTKLDPDSLFCRKCGTKVER